MAGPSAVASSFVETSAVRRRSGTRACGTCAASSGTASDANPAHAMPSGSADRFWKEHENADTTDGLSACSPFDTTSSSSDRKSELTT